METLAEEIGKQGEVVKELKVSNAGKDKIDQEVAKLVNLKKRMTELDPSHPMAHVDKAAKKKKEKELKNSKKATANPEAAGDEMSKNEAKKLAKKVAKKEKKEQHKRVLTDDAPVSQLSEAVYYAADSQPLVTRAATALVGDSIAFCKLPGAVKTQPYYESPSGKLFGDLAISRFILRRNLNTDVLGIDALESSLVDQWTDFALAYPAVGDTAAFAEALNERLAQATYIVGNRLTLADLACWAVLRDWPQAGFEHVGRWLRLCEAMPTIKAALVARDHIAAKPTSPPQHIESANGNDSQYVANAGSTVPVGACPPLDGAQQGKVVTRFPPEPSGYLHVGHCKAVLLNDYYARRYDGKLLVRFDDTNPSKEKEEFAANIIADLETLGIDTSNLSHTSDYFNDIERYAKQLIADGKAFMDNTPQEQMRKEREAKVESKNRDAPVKVSLEKFEAMCKGEAPEWCLRAKIDMRSDNGTLRDPVLYRANPTPHHRTGTRYKAYPTYDMACPIVDSIEGVTHALRTTEYNDRDAQYAWLQDAMKLRKVKVHAFSRINFVRTLMSKRKLGWLVDKKAVDGWDDPRFPTIQGLIRRGVSVQALRDFMIAQGASRNIINLEWDSFWAINKAAYEPTAPRYMAVEKRGCVRIALSNLPGEYAFGGAHYITVPIVPKNPELGSRPVRVSTSVLVDGDDAVTLKVDEEVVLIRWGVFRLTTKKPDGGFTADFVPNGNVKKKKTLHWLADLPASDLCDALLLEYDHILAKPKLEESDELTDPGVLTPVSKVESPALADPGLKSLDHGTIIQLERRGFYRIDQAFDQPDSIVRLIYIPDGKAKAPFSRLPSASPS